ncbi:aldehyde dehydrogenase family protein [Brevundimonas sp. AJA228-03]|uniref:aldehyde dehydrogenase family protein n=1 Tax=Brevundimonas sp. AJA228-03 TaxID=2752515 RepID=UPI001ADF3C21|nr:aldehyde dehydrogenase family protein [Brevundimonas sp. AJA228-03]QTN18321.1 aldehyde dehydrogenase family protein [Brevundimonas sp. AJA228-03]
MDGSATSLDERRCALIARHAPTLAAAIDAVQTRKSWSPWSDSPSTKVHGPDKPGAGKAAFEARLGTTFDLGQPGVVGAVGEEVSPFTQLPLNILYPKSDPGALVAAAVSAMGDWREADFELRLALCLEMAARLYDRNFEMAHSVMHVAGQSYTQAFSGSGPNALDRGVEALAYAAKAMRDVAPSATYHRNFAGEAVALEKTYVLVPRGVGLVICCASFPTWNAYPAMFASLATGNPVIVKPHPIAILPMAIVVETSRAVLTDFGFDPNLVTLSVDSLAEPVAQSLVDDPQVQIIDFTGSPRYGGHLERTVVGKQLFTETAGVNTVVIESVSDVDAVARAVARSSSLFSAQMCTSPQVIYVAPDLFDPMSKAVVEQIDMIANDPAMAAGIMGAIQGAVSLKVVAEVRAVVADLTDVRMLREAAPYAHPEFPDARTLTPLVIAIEAGEHVDLYAEEHFGPVLFLVKKDADEAVMEATCLARTKGSISSYLYSTDETFIDSATPAYEAAGANLSINLTGAMWINFAAAYSDYHVTGLNPAGNACLADLAFVASRFRIVQRRRPAA